MHALILVALLLSQDPPTITLDAPVKEVYLPVKKGDIVPDEGLFMNNAATVATGKRINGAEAAVKSFIADKDNTNHISLPLVLGVVVGLLATGAAVSVGACFATKGCH